MLTSEVIDYLSQEKYRISYFPDDTIEIMRNRIGAAMNIHPDRLFILVSVNFKHNYYDKDPRRLENLFDRLSYNDKYIQKEAFNEYQTVYRSPQLNIPYREYDKTEWLNKPNSIEEIISSSRDFNEFRIFGVEEEKSYILPLNLVSASIVNKISSSRLPVPQLNLLLSSVHDPNSINEFIVIPYSENYTSIANVYYRLLKSNTPQVLNEEDINLMNNNTKLLNDLLNADLPKEKSVNITRLHFHAKFVETDFGDAISSRFEQIFFGITLSKDVPYIGLYNSNKEIMRHKFYVDDIKQKKPYLDLNVWNRWKSVNITGNKQTLLLLRGTDRQNFDRITIRKSDITIILYRDSSNNEKIENMKSDALKWIKTFDAIMAFVNKNDIDSERWELQDIEMNINYKNNIQQLDLRRMNCLSFLFNQKSPDSTEFNFLKTDKDKYQTEA